MVQPPPGAMNLIIPRMEKGVELIGSTPPKSTGFNYPKNGEGNCSNRVSAMSEKDLLRDSGEWSYGSRCSPSEASDQRSLIQ